jgi:hypothetical protein
MRQVKDFTLDDSDPITLDDVRKEIKYWKRAPARHPEWFEQPGFGEKVAARVARLKGLEKRYQEESKAPPLEALTEWAHGHRFLAGLILALVVLLLLGVSFNGLRDLWHSIHAAAEQGRSLSVP